eukprot:PITA_20399
MKLISWNMRGLNSSSKHRILKNMIQSEKPSVVFIQETKSTTTALEKIFNKAWSGSRSVSIDAVGASGGLSIVWKPQILLLRFPLWISGVDFNIITHLEEKKGGRMKLEEDNNGFKEFIRSNQLIDIQTSNGTYTCTNKRRGVHNIASRLDRFLLLDNAIHLGGDFHASILPQGGSDHWPIMLQWTRLGKHCNRPFRYEAF